MLRCVYVCVCVCVCACVRVCVCSKPPLPPSMPFKPPMPSMMPGMMGVVAPPAMPAGGPIWTSPEEIPPGLLVFVRFNQQALSLYFSLSLPPQSLSRCLFVLFFFSLSLSHSRARAHILHARKEGGINIVG